MLNLPEFELPLGKTGHRSEPSSPSPISSVFQLRACLSGEGRRSQTQQSKDITMTRICRAPGCGARTTSRFSVYCSTHKSRLRRHGAVDQKAITKADLRLYLKLVRARIEKNRESPLWAHLEARWAALADHARGRVAFRGAM